MNTGSRHSGDRDALTPEERALADRLARLGPQGEPSPALDARILAAARDAAAAPAPGSKTHATRRHTRRRWPVALGTAATLVVVGGLAWQLRPVDEIHVEYSEAPRAVSGPSADAAPAPREARSAPVGAPAAASAGSALPEAESADAASEPFATPAVQPAPPQPTPTADEQVVDASPAPEAFSAPSPAPEEPPIVFDEPSPMDTPSPPPLRQLAPPPAPPAPPAPAAPAPVAPSPTVAQPQATRTSTAPAERRAAEAKRKAAATQAVEAAATQRDKVVVTGTSVQPARPASAAAAADASALDRIEVTGSRIDAFDAAPAVDQPIDDQPPASADSPQVRQAWLQRVRELLAEGRPDAARESLREYQHRYPQAELPEDLRALLAQ